MPDEREYVTTTDRASAGVEELPPAALPDEPVLLEKMARFGVGSWDARHAFELIAGEVQELVEHDFAGFLTYHSDRHALVVEAIAPIGGRGLACGTQVPADGAIADLLHGSLAAAVCMDTSSSCCALECYLYEAGLRSCITVPLGMDGEGGTSCRPLGLLSLSSRRRGQFQTRHRAVLQRLQRPIAVTLGHVLSNPPRQQAPRFFERSTELDKMRSIHDLSGGIAHRLNNIFAGVLGNARLIMEGSAGPQATDYLQRLYEAGLEGARIVRAMQQFVVAQAPTIASHVDLRDVIEDVARITDGLWRHQVESQRINLQCATDEPGGCLALASAAELREATVNLVFNSIQALPDGGTITLSTRTQLPWATIEVRDDGVGMDGKTLQRCTEPFFTTRDTACGLGLSIAAGTARKYGGHLQIRSRPGQGTEVKMMLPGADDGA